jgi:hypothetical protein
VGSKRPKLSQLEQDEGDLTYMSVHGMTRRTAERRKVTGFTF